MTLNRGLLVLFLPVFLAVSSARTQEPPSNFTIIKQRAADKVTLAKEQGVTVFVVSSSNGIGWAKIRSEKAWPMKAKVRLKYADGREWKHLEQFSINTSRAVISTNLRGGLEVRPTNDAGREALADLAPDELARRVGIELSTSEGAIDILLPMSWLASENEFTIRWIDQFRN